MKRPLQLKLILGLLACSQLANADVGFAQIPKKIKVAVIDTGIDPELLKGNSYCDTGHKDFTETGLKDSHGHGTHISGIVDQYAKNHVFKPGKTPSDIDKIKANYCQIIIKYYDPKAEGQDNLENTIKSFKWAIEQRVDVINYSGGGESFSTAEKAVVEEALNKGIKIVVAAGNEHCELNADCNEYAKDDNDIILRDRHGKPVIKKKRPNTYYPALYDQRIYVVGNLVGPNRSIASTSNYGDAVKYWEVGTNVLSRLPTMSYGFMTGTSQATAIKTGKLVREMLDNK